MAIKTVRGENTPTAGVVVRRGDGEYWGGQKNRSLLKLFPASIWAGVDHQRGGEIPPRRSPLEAILLTWTAVAIR